MQSELAPSTYAFFGYSHKISAVGYNIKYKEKKQETILCNREPILLLPLQLGLGQSLDICIPVDLPSRLKLLDSVCPIRIRAHHLFK